MNADGHISVKAIGVYQFLEIVASGGLQVGKTKFDVKQTSAIPCPQCQSPYQNIIDTRFVKETAFGCYGTRRRRLCLECDYRFSTVEISDADVKKIVRHKGFVTIKMLRTFSEKLKKELNGRYKE